MKVKPAGKQGAVTVELGKREERLLAGSDSHPIPIQHILVPIDFSDFSYKSLDYAAAFARQSNAKVSLLHVVPLNYVDTDLIAFDYSQIQKEAAHSAQARLENLRLERIGPGVETQTHVSIGRPVEEIIATAKRLDVDLIIMSTHGYTGLKHAFLGSTTENVVRYAPCPVLTLRQREHDFVPSPLPTKNLS